MEKFSAAAKEQIMDVLGQEGYKTYASLLNLFDVYLTDDPDVIAYTNLKQAKIVFNEGLTIEQVSVIARHEILHNWLDHYNRGQAWSATKDFELDPEAFNVAADFEISNKGYTEADKRAVKSIRINNELRQGLVTELDFPGHENDTLEELLDALASQAKSVSQRLSKMAGDHSQQQGQDGQNGQDGNDGDNGDNGDNDGDNQGDNSGNNDGDKQGDKGNKQGNKQGKGSGNQQDDNGQQGGGDSKNKQQQNGQNGDGNGDGDQDGDNDNDANSQNGKNKQAGKLAKEANKLAKDAEKLGDELDKVDDERTASPGGGGLDDYKTRQAKNNITARATEIAKRLNDVEEAEKAIAETRRNKSVEAQAKRDAQSRRFTNSDLYKFKTSLMQFIKNQVAEVEEDDSYARPSRRELGGTLLPGQVSDQTGKRPLINVYLDVSGSFSDPGKTAAALRAIDSVKDFQRRGLIDFRQYYHSSGLISDVHDNIIDIDGKRVNSWDAGESINQHIARTKPTNVIVLTDSDPDSTENTTVTVPGGVWLLFFGDKSENLINRLHGRRLTRVYDIIW